MNPAAWSFRDLQVTRARPCCLFLCFPSSPTQRIRIREGGSAGSSRPFRVHKSPPWDYAQFLGGFCSEAPKKGRSGSRRGNGQRELGHRTLLKPRVQSHRTQLSFDSPESVRTGEEPHLPPHAPQSCLTRDPSLSMSQAHVPDPTEWKLKPVSPFQEGRCVSCPQPSPREAQK